MRRADAFRPIPPRIYVPDIRCLDEISLYGTGTPKPSQRLLIPGSPTCVTAKYRTVDTVFHRRTLPQGSQSAAKNSCMCPITARSNPSPAYIRYHVQL